MAPGFAIGSTRGGGGGLANDRREANAKQVIESKASKRNSFLSRQVVELNLSNHDDHDHEPPTSPEVDTRGIFSGANLDQLIKHDQGRRSSQRTVVVDIQNGRRKSPPTGAAKQVEPASASVAATAKHHEQIPTFGRAPAKVGRAPYYYSYGGSRAANVSLISAADRPKSPLLPTTRSSLRCGSIASSRSSSLQSDTSERQKVGAATGGGQAGKTRRMLERVKQLQQRGYSNLSNLFPRQTTKSSLNNRWNSVAEISSRAQPAWLQPKAPANDYRGQQQRQQVVVAQPARHRASSLLNFNQQQPKSAISSTMRRQNSAQHFGVGGKQLAQPLAQHQPPPVGQRAGAKIGKAADGAPSAGALQYQHQHQAARTGSGERQLGSAGALYSPYSPSGDSDLAHAAGYADDDTLAGDQHQLDNQEPLDFGDAQMYYAREQAPARARARPPSAQQQVYASSSPLSPDLDNQRNQHAYYNQRGRFSVYQSSGQSAAAPLATLASPAEQLRRIAGPTYQHQHQHRLAAAKPTYLHPQWAYSRPFQHLLPTSYSWSSASPTDADLFNSMDGVEGAAGDALAASLQFVALNKLVDTQAIRAVDFHPSGQVYAIGSNSRALRICAYPAADELNPLLRGQSAGNNNNNNTADSQPAGGQAASAGAAGLSVERAPRVLFKFLQVHRGSIYCVKFNKSGQLLATGSNDQTVHIVKYNSRTHSPEGDEYRLTMHDGIVRDVCFIEDQTNGSSLLLSAGGGDNKIYVTDCDTITPYQSFAGHTQAIMALHHLGGAQFVSGSQDRTIRFWDLRTRQCTSIVSAPPAPSQATGAGAKTNQLPVGPGAPISALSADVSGRLLASGHNDATCMLYDTRGARIIQTFRPHDDEIRSVQFSPQSYYLLTGGYDGRVVLSDLQGDLNKPLPSQCVAQTDDKVIQACWHPKDFTFVTTSANKSAVLWVPPSE